MEYIAPMEETVKHRMSGPEVCKTLGISKMTLYKWVLQGKLRPKKIPLGARVLLGYDEDEVYALKGRMVKTRSKGKPLLRQ